MQGSKDDQLQYHIFCRGVLKLSTPEYHLPLSAAPRVALNVYWNGLMPFTWSSLGLLPAGVIWNTSARITSNVEPCTHHQPIDLPVMTGDCNWDSVVALSPTPLAMEAYWLTLALIILYTLVPIWVVSAPQCLEGRTWAHAHLTLQTKATHRCNGGNN